MAEGTVRIVPYEPHHLPRICEITIEGFQGVSVDYLIEQAFGRVEPGWQERKLADIRRTVAIEPSGIFVALDGDEVIGYVTVETSEAKSIGRIVDLAVDARYRRRGIGSQLIDRAIEYIKERGMRFAKIETLATNESGQVVYPKRGFREIVRQIHYVLPLDDPAADGSQSAEPVPQS